MLGGTLGPQQPLHPRGKESGGSHGLSANFPTMKNTELHGTGRGAPPTGETGGGGTCHNRSLWSALLWTSLTVDLDRRDQRDQRDQHPFSSSIEPQRSRADQQSSSASTDLGQSETQTQMIWNSLTFGCMNWRPLQFSYSNSLTEELKFHSSTIRSKLKV